MIFFLMSFVFVSPKSRKVNRVDGKFLNSLASVYQSKAQGYATFEGGSSMGPMIQSQNTSAGSKLKLSRLQNRTFLFYFPQSETEN